MTAGRVTAQQDARGGSGGAGGGGSGAGGAGGAGGNAIGFIGGGVGTDDRFAGNGSATVTVATLLFDSASLGGAGGAGGVGMTGTGQGGAGGNGNGSTLGFGSAGGTVVFGDTTIFSNAAGGAGGMGSSTGNGGNAIGGTVLIGSGANALGEASGSFTGGALSIDVSARGGDGMRGGDGTGGTGRTGANTGSAHFLGNVSIDAEGYGGSGLRGGNGIGGLAQAAAIAGGTNRIDGALLFEASGFGRNSTDLFGAGVDNRGGNGSGGVTNILAMNGSMTVAGDATLLAQGFGGSGGVGNGATASGSGGSGTGGSARVLVDSAVGTSTLTTGFVVFDGRGRGGDGGSSSTVIGGSGGTGTGGTATAGSTSSAGTVVSNSIALDVYGDGGRGGGGVSMGSGGNGFGGSAVVGSGQLASTQTGSLSYQRIDLNADGAGRGTGEGRGGSVEIGVNGGVMSMTNSVITAIGTGAVSRGGSASVRVGPHSVQGGISTLSAGALSINASANPALTAGNAFAGRVVLSASGGGLTAVSADLSAQGDAVAPGALASALTTRNGTITITGDAPNNNRGDLTITARGDLALAADGGAMTIAGRLTATSGGAIIASVDGSAIASPATITADQVVLSAAVGISTPAPFSSRSLLSFATTGTIALGDLAAPGAINLSADASLSLGNVIAGAGVRLASLGAVGTGNIRAENDVRITSGTSLTTGNVSTATSVALSTTGTGSNINTGAISAGIINPSTAPGATFGVRVDATGEVTTGAITAAGNIGVIARGGSLTTGALSASRAVVLLDANGPSTGITTGSIRSGAGDAVYIANHSMAPSIFIDALGNADYTALLASNPAPVAGFVTINGTVDTGILRIAALGAINVTGTINAALGAVISGGSINLANINAGDLFDLMSGTDITLGNARSEGDLEAVALGNITTGTLSAGDTVRLTAVGNAQRPGSISTGAIDAGILRRSIDPLARYGVALDATGNVSSGTILARGPIGIAARSGTIAVGAITSGSAVGLLGRTGVTTRAVTTGTGQVLLIADASMASLITEDANGNLDYSALIAATPVALAGPVMLGGDINAGDIRIATSGAVTGLIEAGSVVMTASGPVFIRAGSVALGAVSGGGLVDIRSLGALGLGNVRGERDIDLDGGTGIVVGNVSAGDSVSISLNDAAPPTATISVGTVDAGILRPSTDSQAGYQIAIGGTGNVTTGTLTARGNVGVLSRNAAINSGAIGTQASVLLLANSGVSVGGISTGTTGTAYITNAVQESLVNKIEALGPPSGFDFAPVFALAPVRIAGPISLSGPVSTGRFVAAGSGTFSAQAISAGTSVNIDSGNRASFGGQVTAPTITVRSSDIAIGTTAGLGGAATTALTLNVDTAASAVLLGGTASESQTGYGLDAAEIGRLRATTIAINAMATSAPLVTVNAFTLTGTGTAQTGNSFQIAAAGRVRVNGAAVVNGAGSGDSLQISAATIEVVTDNGGALRLVDTAGAAAGTLRLTAGTIAVADAALLAQLSSDTTIVNRDALLNAAPATPLAAPALAGGSIIVSARTSFLVRNSGTPATRAGFATGIGGMTITSAGSTPLDVVINGTTLDSAGALLTNNRTIERVTFTPGPNGNGFTSGSTVDGCVVGGSCADVPELPETPEERETVQKIENVATNIAATIETLKPLTAQEEEQQAEAGEAAGNLPDVRLSRLIDVGAVRAQAVVNEPVTSDGNPAMWTDLAAPPLRTPAPGEQK